MPLFPTHSQTSWRCFNNSCTWRLRTQLTKITWHGRKLFSTLTVTSHFLLPPTSLVILQTPLINHILLLRYDLSPLLMIHFLNKCVHAYFIMGRSCCGGSEDPQSAWRMLCPLAAETCSRHQDAPSLSTSTAPIPQWASWRSSSSAVS